MNKTICLLLLLFQALPSGADFSDLCAAGDTAAVRSELASGGAAWLRDERGMTPLHHTARAGVSVPLNAHLDIIRILAESGADINAKDDDGVTPLCLSLAGGGLTRMTLLMLELGADPNMPSGGSLPLNHAAANGSAGQVRALVDAGAYVNIPDEHGVSPLMSALLAGRDANARVLIEAGADVNERCSVGLDNGVTPLMAAAALAGVDTVKLLLTMGADARASSRAGLTAADYAEMAGNDENTAVLRTF